MQPHQIVSRQEWIEARKAYLAREKELTRARERLGSFTGSGRSGRR
jgi:predicted dithiol-disulfide oxidoreductase (DUF899 family)